MDKLVRKIEVPLAKRAVSKAGLYVVPRERNGELAKIAADAYTDYPLHNWFTKGKYDPVASEMIMKITLDCMAEDAVIYADSDEMKGFAVWIPQGFTGSKTIPFLLNGGFRLIMHCGPGIILRLLRYEMFAMKKKHSHTEHMDWYLYNLSIKRDSQGKGIASKLLKPMLGFCDDEKMTAYLETNKEGNVSLYEHFGFSLDEESVIPGSDIIHYSMCRIPM